MTRYWLITTSSDNFERSADHGWTVQGFKARQGKKAAQMQPGDILIYYLTGVKSFAGYVEVASASFEDHKPIWRSEGRPDELYPWRVRVEPKVILGRPGWLEAEPIARELDHVRKWPAKNWTLAFQGNLREIPAADGQRLVEAINQRAVEPASASS